ncbi:hypothetical protein AVEN_133534-1, partial [Araneus ventricosus]
MDRNCEHQNIYYSGKREFYFFTWSIPNVSSINNLNVSTVNFTMKNGCTYNGTLIGSKEKITFTIASVANLKCFVSMFIGSETLLLSNSLNVPTRTAATCSPCTKYYDLITLSSGDESFEKLKQHPNDTSILICRIIYRVETFSTRSLKTPVNIPTDSLYDVKMFVDALKNSSESLTTEKVLLRVGDETEIVSKALLCARSPVFAKMFENDMRELKEKTVTITDIKMPVLKVLVSFLYTGKLWNSDSDLASNGDFDFLCDLYYASDKYNIIDLR